MSKEICFWEHTGDGEFVTTCGEEHATSDFDNEELLQVLLFTFCPFCGRKIEQQPTPEGQN